MASPSRVLTLLALAVGMLAWPSAVQGQLQDIRDKDHPFVYLCLAPDGKHVVTADSGFRAGDSVQVWDIATGKAVKTFTPHKEGCHFAFSPDGKTLYTAGYKELTAWSFPECKALRSVETPKGLGGPVVSPDGKLIALRGFGVLLYEAETLKAFGLPAEQPHTSCLAFSPDGKLLAAGVNGDKHVLVWEVATWKKLAVLAEHKRIVTSLAFSPDGKTLASSGADRSVVFNDTGTWKRSGDIDLTDYGGRVYDLAYTPDGKTLAIGLSSQAPLLLWDVAANQPRRDFRMPKSLLVVLQVSMSADGKLIATLDGGSDGCKIWEVPPLKGSKDK